MNEAEAQGFRRLEIERDTLREALYNLVTCAENVPMDDAMRELPEFVARARAVLPDEYEPRT